MASSPHSPSAENSQKRSMASPGEGAVIYCRVSSDRQAKEGDGARSQEQRCHAFAEAQGYEVVRTFSDDGVSGAAISRPAMEAMLAFLEGRASETVVLVDDISRIARDVRAHAELRAAIKLAGGRLESPSMRFEETAAGEFIEYVLAAAAQYGRKGNREQVLNRMKARLQMGYWTFPPPMGYKYARHPLHKKWLVPTTEAKAVLGPALAGFANGRFASQRELALHLDVQGFFDKTKETAGKVNDKSRAKKRGYVTILDQRVSRLFDQLFLYAGRLEYPSWNIEQREGKHEAVVSSADYARIKERLARKSNLSLSSIGAARADSSESLILRNFVRCVDCGRPLTGCLAHHKWPRYYCYHQPCARYGHSISANGVLHPAFKELLSSLAPAPDFLELVERVAPEQWEKKMTEWETQRKSVQMDSEAMEERVRSLVRRLATVSESLVPDLEKEVITLKAAAQEAKNKAAKYEEAPPDYGKAYQAVSTLFADPLGWWENGSDSDKRTVHRIVFTRAPAFDRNTGFSTYDLSLPYRISATLSGKSKGLVDSAGAISHHFLLTDIDWTWWFDTILRWAEWPN